MLQGDRTRIEQALSLLFSLPGTPLLVYGDELGMGDDLSLPERESVRTAMQWSDERNAGFSSAEPDRLSARVIASGPFSYRKVNVAAQERAPDSLLAGLRRIIRARRECPEFGWGHFSIIETGQHPILAHRCECDGRTVVAVHNLGERPATVELDLSPTGADHVVAVIGAQGTEAIEDGICRLRLEGYGYRWLRAVAAPGSRRDGEGGDDGPKRDDDVSLVAARHRLPGLPALLPG
jgi:maltose alpha-D-glucosyltransferase / alpha-amylase